MIKEQDKMGRMAGLVAVMLFFCVGEVRGDLASALGALDRQEYGKAYDACLDEADHGSGACRILISCLHEQGLGRQKDDAAALSWLQQAADQGDAGAMWLLGQRYFKGQLLEKDLGKAAHWLQRSAQAGFARAQNMLGMMYEKGRGVAVQVEEAISWYRKAAEVGGLADAMFNLGRMYEGGMGVEVDHEQALNWFRKAAQQGHVGARHELGHVSGEASDFGLPPWRIELNEALGLEGK